MKRPVGFIPPLGPPRPDARQRALNQWRGLDISEREKARARPAQALGDIMPKVLTQMRMDRRRSEAEIVRAWNHLLDPVITAHAQPAGINKGTLFVTIDHSIWLDEIVRYRRKEILQRLQHTFGRDLIQRISFRLG
jgi:predicted nucleic acid-binding Zn ribbon protein